MLGLEYRILSLLFSCIFLLQALAVRFVLGTFLFPAALFSLCWFCFTLVPLLAVPSAPFNPLAILYMSAGTFAFMLAALPFDWRRAYEKNRDKAPAFCRSFDSRFIHYCLAAAILFSFVFSTLGMIGNGIDWRSLLFNMLETSRIYAARRGHENLGYGIVGMLGVLFTYIAPVFGGFLFQAKKAPGKRLIVFFASLAPALYVMLTQSTKLALLNALAFFIAAVLLVKIVSGDLAFFRFSHLAKAVAVLLLVAPLVLISFMSRAGYTDLHEPIRAVRSMDFTLKSYTVGEIYAFSDFFSQRIGMPSEFNYPSDGYSLGNYSFKFVFDTLHISRKFPPGFYREAYRSGNAFATNIFTVFRGLIHDFGVFGSILCLFLLGLIFHAAYYRILVGANPCVPCAIFVVMIDFIILSYLFSIFNSRYSLLLAATLAVVLFVNGTIASKPGALDGLIKKARTVGLAAILKAAWKRIAGRRVKNYRLYQDLFRGKQGIEIGGPSPFFKREIPIYPVVASLDGVNFSRETIWQGTISEGGRYGYCKGRSGRQYVSDAVCLSQIGTEQYDFVLSCNNLEHIANPLKALQEMARITKPGGLLLLVLPKKESNFDHRRSVTTIEHLDDDLRNGTPETDMTHLDEILALHDLARDPAAGDFAAFQKRSLANVHNRCLHHHVFDMNLLENVFERLHIETVAKDSTRTDFVIAGRKGA